MIALLRFNLTSALTGVFLSCLAAGAASAQEVCGQFQRSVTGRVDLFDTLTPTFKNGDGVPLIGVFSVALRPREEVVYPVRAGNTRGGDYGGIVTIENVAAGRYRIALAGDVRVEAVQLFRALPLTEIAYDPGCPGEVTRVEVTANDGPLTLQIDDARAPRLTIAVYRP
jgi:hypothetical protein